MVSRNRRRKRGFLEQYKIDDAYLRRPDRQRGRVGLWEATGPGGSPALIKVWPRSAKQDDSDLEEIWRHEIRQLHRMAGHPVAHDVIARLSDAGMEDDGFYLVLDPGDRRPLEVILQRGVSSHWLKQPRIAANRLRIWRNIKRLAIALEALHSEGMLHRDIDSWSVLTAGSEEPDFQLTGFEWSMRLVLTAARRGSKARNQQGGTASFRSDWALFARLVATLISAEWGRVENLAIAAFEVEEHLSAAEVRLLRNLAGIELLDRLDGDVVVSQIDQILTAVAASAAGKDTTLKLVLDLRPESNLAREVARHLKTDPRSIANELSGIIEGDLGGNVQLIGVRREDSDVLGLVLRGHDYWYRLQPYRPPRATESSWDYASCNAISREGPAPLSVVGSITLPASAIEPMSGAEAPQRFARGRNRARSWETLRSRLEPARSEQSDIAEFQRALTLTLVVELLFAVAETFPVSIVNAPTDGEQAAADQEEAVHLAPRAEPDRDELAKALGLPSPATRLSAALSGDGIRREGWTLTTAANLGDRSPKDTDWKFDREIAGRNGKPVFRFTGAEPPPFRDEPLFLIPEDAVGRDSQFRRRLKALAALREHLELQRVLTDPKTELTPSHDREPSDEELKALDKSKREAMRNIVGLLPIYLVQGPPGVGKTRLVRELVGLKLSEEPSLRFLMSAQSNAAVDHLLDEVVPMSGRSDPPPLIVRCRSGRDRDNGGLSNIGKVSEAVLTETAKSRLVADARPALRDKLAKLERGAQALAKPDTRKKRGVPGLRNFEGIVMRAANLVFATTNSADLERLIDEHSQFDWTIIEEAGKATGTELVAPLLLSHRRLMIGDHKQLPPYNSDRIIEFLSNPENVVRALRIGSEYVGRNRDETTESILDEIEEHDDAAPALCSSAIQALTLFQTLIEEEFQRRTGRSGLSCAMRLTQQHRMHPAIARIIGHTFYSDSAGGALTTDPEAEAKFHKGPSPIVSLDPARLPDVPIVLVDTGSRQESGGKVTGEERPRWNNREEREAVSLVLNLLRPNPGTAPTLAILSPYAQQVLKLNEMLFDPGMTAPDAAGFTSPTSDGRYCFTVDSFQGSEADATIVSLVRNNDHSAIRSALGFLADPRRMNVLLSRAKWRLVLVGAFDFLEEVLKGARLSGTSADIEFLGTLLAEFKNADATEVRRVGLAELRGTAA